MFAPSSKRCPSTSTCLAIFGNILVLAIVCNHAIPFPHTSIVNGSARLMLTANRLPCPACNYHSPASLLLSALFSPFSFTGNEAFVVPARTFSQVQVGGRERAKYFRKPLVPFTESIPPLVVLDVGRSPAGTLASSTFHSGATRLTSSNPPALTLREPATRTQAIQTDYMEREAQTDPYTPEYVVRPGEQPEVLTLATLMYSRWFTRECFRAD